MDAVGIVPPGAYLVTYDHLDDGSVYANYQIDDMSAPAQPGASFVSGNALCTRDSTDMASACTVLTVAPSHQETAQPATSTDHGMPFVVGITIPIVVVLVVTGLLVKCYLSRKHSA